MTRGVIERQPGIMLDYSALDGGIWGTERKMFAYLNIVHDYESSHFRAFSRLLVHEP